MGVLSFPRWEEVVVDTLVRAVAVAVAVVDDDINLHVNNLTFFLLFYLLFCQKVAFQQPKK